MVHSPDPRVTPPFSRRLALPWRPAHIYCAAPGFYIFDFFLAELSGMEVTDTLDMESEDIHAVFPFDPSPSTKNSFMSMVPIEVYQNIFQFVGKQDLATLSRVSHTFQHEAEYILYEFVDLTLGNYRTGIISWCTAVTHIQRRAHRVHSLHFPSASGPPSSTAISDDLDVSELIARAFNAVVNLKHLYFVGPQDGTVSPSSFKDCTFSLSLIMGEIPKFTSQDQIDFLMRHPEIEYWVANQSFLLSASSLPEAILPRLRELVLIYPALTRAFKGRPIESLVLFFIDPMHTRAVGLEAVAPLEFFGGTLHTLEYIHGELTKDWSTMDIMVTLAEKTPNLSSLSFTSLANNDLVMIADNQQDLVDAVSRFRHLETLSFDIEMGDRKNCSSPLHPLEQASPTQFRIATLLMAACPSLQRLCFLKSRNYNSARLSYVRSKVDGSVRLDGSYCIDSPKWWAQ